MLESLQEFALIKEDAVPPRLKEIAGQLGLSVTTVSRALAGYPDVSERTRKLVHDTAREMGYVPNVLAQQLQRKRTNAIGFIIPTFGPRFSDPFFSELIAGIGNEAGRRGYDLLISTVAPGPDEIEMYRRQAYSRRVDGMLVVRTRADDPRIAFLTENNFPFVAFGHTAQPFDFPWVDVDGEVGTRLAVEHLVSLGHREIAYLGSPPELMFSRLRDRGFRQALASAGLTLRPEWLLSGNLTQRSGYDLAESLLTEPGHPTAIVAANDLMALGAMSAAQQSGLEVPRDLSVVGFDDIPLAETSHPTLTTIRQPIYRIATRITGMLIDLLDGATLTERHALLVPDLVVRASTASRPT